VINARRRVAGGIVEAGEAAGSLPFVILARLVRRRSVLAVGHRYGFHYLREKVAIAWCAPYGAPCDG